MKNILPFPMLRLLISGILLTTTIRVSIAGEPVIPFDSVHWDLHEANVAPFLGRTSLGGTAFLKNSGIENGVIELDLAVTGQRCYPGVLFHAASHDDYERIYVRPHLPSYFQNVIQYVSVFNGIDSWQLFSGESNTASAEIPRNQWVHLKIEFNSMQARLYLGDNPDPVLIIASLGHGARKGTIGLDGPKDGSAWFSNFSCREDNSLHFPMHSPAEVPWGVVKEWQISRIFNFSGIDNEKTPEEQGLTDLQWIPASCRNDGILDISRYYSRTGNPTDLVFARTFIDSDKDENRLFSFGYSDVATIFLNGRLLFAGNSSYGSRDPSFQGVVGLYDYLNLPLKKGKNELMVALAESFGGWGLIFRDTRAVYQDTRLKKMWELKKGLHFPESVEYDRKRDVLYVSNFYNDGKESISKVSTTGEILQAEWVTGIRQPSGLCIDNNRLYAVGRFALVEIDPGTGSILNRYPFPDPAMPNDVTADGQGNLYITDSRKNMIYRMSGGHMEEWLQSADLPKPNGILFDRGKLLVGTSGDGCIKLVDPSTKSVSTLVCTGRGSVMDGLVADGNGGYLISDFNGRVFRVSGDGKKQLLLDTTAPERTCAAFGYIQEKRLLVIPSFTGDRVEAYEYPAR